MWVRLQWTFLPFYYFQYIWRELYVKGYDSIIVCLDILPNCLYLAIFFSICAFHFQIGSTIILCLVAQSCVTLCDTMGSSLIGSSVHRDSRGKNIEVGCHAQGLNPDLPHGRRILYCLSYQGKGTIILIFLIPFIFLSERIYFCIFNIGKNSHIMKKNYKHRKLQRKTKPKLL